MQAQPHAACNINCNIHMQQYRVLFLLLYFSVHAYKKISKTCPNFLIGSFCWQHAHAYLHKIKMQGLHAKGRIFLLNIK